METIVEYFSAMPKAHRSALLVGGLAFFFFLEGSLPLFKMEYNRWKHAALNIFFTLTTVLVNLSMALLLVKSAEYVTDNQFGLIQWIPMGVVLQGIIGLLLLDLIGAWLAHYVEHRISWMWKFHVIHHTDQNVDSTTANRHHPGESVIRFAFTLIAVWTVGAPIWLVFIYQTLSLVLTQFNHSNVNMPKWLDDALMLVVCTPNMHRVHHHYRLPYSDTNYGNIFSFWDKMFGTYSVVDNEKLVYGVDTYMDKEEVNDVVALLKIPFSKYRPPLEYDDEEVL